MIMARPSRISRRSSTIATRIVVSLTALTLCSEVYGVGHWAGNHRANSWIRNSASAIPDPSARQQPRTALICVAFAISASASATLTSFPLCDATSLMNAPSVPHDAESLACTFACAVCSFASSEVLVPSLADRFVTAMIRSASCSAAPLTCTVKLHDAWLPEGSCAVLFTVVVPIANTLPDAGIDDTVAEQLSPAVGANVAVAPSGSVASTVIGAGHAMSGASTSLSVTLNLHIGCDCGNDELAAVDVTLL